MGILKPLPFYVMLRDLVTQQGVPWLAQDPRASDFISSTSSLQWSWLLWRHPSTSDKSVCNQNPTVHQGHSLFNRGSGGYAM